MNPLELLADRGIRNLAEEAAGYIPGGLPAVLNPATASLVSLLPIAGFALYLEFLAGLGETFVRGKKWGVHSLRHIDEEDYDIHPGVYLWELRCWKPSVTKDLTGYEVWLPSFRTIQFFHSGGALTHPLLFSNSAIFDATGRLRTYGKEYPAQVFWGVDPVQMIAPSWPNQSGDGGWVYLASTGAYGNWAPRPDHPTDWEKNIRNRMTTTGEAIYDGMDATPGRGGGRGSPPGGYNPQRREGGDGVGRGAAALAILGLLAKGLDT